MILNLTRSFARTERGAMSIEAVLAIPLLVWALTATFVFFDAFKTLNVSQKATYTIADMISREENGIDMDYLTAVHEVFDYLAVSEGANALRVTVVSMKAGDAPGTKELNFEYSEAVGGIAGHESVAPLAARIPDMGVGDWLIVVETEQNWSPAFTVGLTNYRFREVALARPRFAPQVPWNES